MYQLVGGCCFDFSLTLFLFLLALVSSPKKRLQQTFDCFNCFLKICGQTAHPRGQLSEVRKENVLIDNKGKSSEEKKVTFVVVFEAWGEIVLFVL